MTARPPVLLLDDGELDDVRALLGELGAEVEHLRGGAVPSAIEPADLLLVATPRRAVLAQSWPPARGRPPRPTKICVVDGDSNTLRAMLRRMGFDLLIRRPVHRDALRLVLQRALYRGDERRRDDRVAIGFEVQVRSGLRRRSALLADLSIRGGRLLSDQSFPVGARLSLQVPRELTGGRALTLRARVIRSASDPHGEAARHAVALSFDKLGTDARRRLYQLLKDRAQGPARLARSPAAAAEKDRSDAARPGPAAAAGSQDRRKHERVAYAREVTPVGDLAGTALMGRDLSVGGMRVEAGCGLARGDVVELALYGEAAHEPFRVRARVVRDDGPEGLGLQFENLPPGVATRLEALVGDLPAVESLDGEEADAMGSVVSQILERLDPRR